MILPDANLLLYAVNSAAPEHRAGPASLRRFGTSQNPARLK